VGRTLIVGDVHGCTGELETLLEQVGFVDAADRLVLVGDLVVRGPDSHGTLALVRRLGARTVRGNHEQKLLTWRSKHEPLGPEHARVAEAMNDEEWAQLETMPLWIDLPEHDVRVVHAGVLTGVAPEETPAAALLKMRTIDERGRWSDEPDAGPLWGKRYAGPPHVVFGHNARPDPQVHPWATGIDTGCVYGGRLTGILLEQGEPMPRGDQVRGLLRSVPAMRKYYGGKGAPLT
jgi:Calcineurin-like phosphoesterase